MTEEKRNTAAEELGTKYRLDNKELWRETQLLAGPGVYRLHVVDERGEFRRLGRLFGDDAKGILYIGAAGILKNQIGALWKSLNAIYREIDSEAYADLPCYKSVGHQTGKRIREIPEFVKKFPFERLRVTTQLCESAQEAQYALEVRLLKAYEQQYGELPPLNRSRAA